MQRLESFQALLAKLCFPFLNQRFSGLTDNILEIPDPSLVKASCRWAAEYHYPPANRGCWLPLGCRLHLKMQPLPFSCACVIQAHPMGHPLPLYCQLLTPGLTARLSGSGMENVGVLTSSVLIHYITLIQKFLFRLLYLPF